MSVMDNVTIVKHPCATDAIRTLKDITPAQHHVLMVLATLPDATVKAVAETTRYSVKQAARVLDALVYKGHVTVTVQPGRATLYHTDYPATSTAGIPQDVQTTQKGLPQDVPSDTLGYPKMSYPEPLAEERAPAPIHTSAPEVIKNQSIKTKDSAPEKESGAVEVMNETEPSSPENIIRLRPRNERRNDWYDAIMDIWHYTGAMNGAMEKMLRGVATDPAWKAGNVTIPDQKPLTSAHIRAWSAWYRATELGGNDSLNMLENRMKIASSIEYWVAMGCPMAPEPERAPSPFDGLVIIR